ncbi:MAG: APC family permease [Methanomicrobiales archaeon]|nr:APC family permease [Methanomicrobiales archaeon]
MTQENGKQERESIPSRVRHALIGAKRNIADPSLFHKIALIPVLAWIGLGADGLSSSSYGPPEAYTALTTHTYLAIFLALATAVTVFVISYAYTRIIEHFPSGGGGYIVATHTIGEKAGVVSGSALLVDYVLTITVSIAACAAAIFSFVPPEFQRFRLVFAVFLVLLLIILNLRGVKESVLILAPIFLLFIVTHALLLGYGIFAHGSGLGTVSQEISSSLAFDLSTIGLIGILAIFFRAYSLGAGTYTGIEAVANGLQIMREPKVQTGKRTMGYMAFSLAIVAGGLFLCYLLWNVAPVPGKTLNAVLADLVFSGWAFGGLLAFVTILAEGALLMVAAQTGFIDGPRVMANMAIDSWFPRRFASLSERLTMQDGILLMGTAALVLLVFTRGSVAVLVVMYAINVFVTFSLSEFGMSRFFFTRRREDPLWGRHIAIHLTGLVLCLTILSITVFEKTTEGAWLTILITSSVIAICFLIKRHYLTVREGIHRLDYHLNNVPAATMVNTDPVDPKKMTAVQLVTGFNGFGLHTFYSIIRNFPNLYENFIFVSVAVVDSGSFKGAGEVQALEDSVKAGLQKYVDLARTLGFAADLRTATGTDVVETAVTLCRTIKEEFTDSTFYTGQIVFRQESPFHKLLHNETAFAIQRNLQFSGITTVILPVQAEE